MAIINLFENENSLTVQIRKKNKIGDFIASFGSAIYEDNEDLIVVFNEEDMGKFYSAITVDKNIIPNKLKGLESTPYVPPAPPIISSSSPINTSDTPTISNDHVVNQKSINEINNEIMLKALNLPLSLF